MWNKSAGSAAGRTLSRVLGLSKDGPKVVSKPALSTVEGGSRAVNAIVPAAQGRPISFFNALAVALDKSKIWVCDVAT